MLFETGRPPSPACGSRTRTRHAPGTVRADVGDAASHRKVRWPPACGGSWSCAALRRGAGSDGLGKPLFGSDRYLSRPCAVAVELACRRPPVWRCAALGLSRSELDCGTPSPETLNRARNRRQTRRSSRFARAVPGTGTPTVTVEDRAHPYACANSIARCCSRRGSGTARAMSRRQRCARTNDSAH